MLIHGKCHCGNIAFDLELEGNAPELPARACGCSFCVARWRLDIPPKATLAVTIRDRALVSPYAFGTRTATFHVCARCGTVPLVTSEVAVTSTPSSTSTCLKTSTPRGFAGKTRASKAKMSNRVLRADSATGSPMFASPTATPDAPPHVHTALVGLSLGG
jgi:hypothetical protein